MVGLLLHAALASGARCGALRRPWVDQWLLVVRLLRLRVQRLAVASGRHPPEMLGRQLWIRTLSCIIFVSIFAVPMVTLVHVC